MFDTHAHLDLDRFGPDRDAAVDRAVHAGVTRILVPGVAPDTWEAMARFAERHAVVRVAVGVHPQVLPDADRGDIRRALAELPRLLRDMRAVAVGETGLDGPSARAGAELAWQEEVCAAHLDAARATGLPVVLHCLRAQDAMLRLVRRYAPLRGVMHSYSGGPELVRPYTDAGLHVSFAGPVTFPGARKPIEAARRVPADRLLVETDSPDQAPDPRRGGRNEPAWLPYVIDGLARARGEAPEDVARRTHDNAVALFGD